MVRPRMTAASGRKQGLKSGWRLGVGLFAALFLVASGVTDVFAFRGGGRSASVNRSASFSGGSINRSASVNRSAQFSGATGARGTIGGTANINRNANVNVNRNVNVNGGYYGGRPYPVPVPAYGYGAGAVAAGVAAGAMLTMLPATAIAVSNSSKQTVYMVDQKCYREVYDQGNVAYQPIPCP